MTDSILIIDDDVTVLRSLGTFFEQHGWDVYRELSGEAGLTTFDRTLADVVLVGLKLPGIDGFEVLDRLRGRETAVIVLTSDGDVPTAVRAMQSGAENFLTKPIDLPQLQVTADRAVEKVRLRRVNRTLIGQSSTAEGLDSLGTSALMREVARQVTLLAHGDRAAVLLQGEPGTGKRWVARLLHDVSPRGSAPFIEVACGAGDATWLETELFGRDGAAGEPGAERRQGLVEVADGGSLFLDEITDLPLELQAKLLGMLETRAFRRVGGHREIPVDVRVIAATARPLPAAVEAGKVRQDLYYCLNVMPVTIPPLRERSRDDFLALIRRFLKELGPATPGAPGRLSDEALDRLLKHAWPGNLSELHNVLERALLLARGSEMVGVEHLPPEFRGRFTSPLDRRHTPLTLEELERMHIDRTLKHHGGNRTHAALELGISRATLIAKIKRYAIPG